MTSDNTRHTARLTPGHERAWQVSWLPGRHLDRNSAITAMVLADVVGADQVRTGHRLWPHIEGWAAELGLTAPDALAGVSQLPSSVRTERDAAVPEDPEAAGA